MVNLRRPLRACFDAAERFLALAFPASWNPLLNLAALGFFFYWIVTVSGIYIYVFFDTGVTLIANKPIAGVDSKDPQFGLDNAWG